MKIVIKFASVLNFMFYFQNLKALHKKYNDFSMPTLLLGHTHTTFSVQPYDMKPVRHKIYVRYEI